MTMPSTPPPPPLPLEIAAALSERRARQALRLVCAEMPHLAGLANLVRVKPDEAFPVAAVSSSGLVCVNPQLFARLPLADAAFVFAHELLHLALDTHRRQGDADPHVVNVAHDYIINDMLASQLDRAVPLGGLVMAGARFNSLEGLVTELMKSGKPGRTACWGRGKRPKQRGRQPLGKSPMREALEKAGLVPPEEEPPQLPPPPSRSPLGDLISPTREQALEPEISPELREQLRQQVRKAAAKANSLGALRAKIDEALGAPLNAPESRDTLMRAIHTAYQPPWQLALQRWLDAVAPAGRTYARASRRGAERDDGVVLCGRNREGWTLHIVLDTSGSMLDALPRMLGAIAAFCEGAGVSQIHMLQCDVQVTRDEWLDPAQLAEYRITGFGGSDMSPALHHLSEDTEVHAVLVLTDGFITYPSREPPYQVLWALMRSYGEYATGFRPPYGEVVFLDK